MGHLFGCLENKRTIPVESRRKMFLWYRGSGLKGEHRVQGFRYFCQWGWEYVPGRFHTIGWHLFSAEKLGVHLSVHETVFGQVCFGEDIGIPRQGYRPQIFGMEKTQPSFDGILAPIIRVEMVLVASMMTDTLS